MKRTIVSLVSEQTIPNFLFIKEMSSPDDELLFITSKKFEKRVEWMKNALNYATKPVIITLDDGTEEHWDEMVTSIQKELLSDDRQYIVNLTGGTKYMALAVYTAFMVYAETEFYYIPFPKNQMLKVASCQVVPLSGRVSIAEYLANYDVSYQPKEITQDEKYTESFLRYFLNGKVDSNVINLLRPYRDKNISIIDTEMSFLEEGKKPQIPGLSTFLYNIDFPIKEEGKLSKYETQYLTGGWFEEYVYNRIVSTISPQDIKLGLTIHRGEDKTNKNKHRNDLDVVFTYGNKLFVIECKTGIDSEKMFNETIYKAASVKETLLGLSANTYLFALIDQNDKLQTTAKTMGVTFFDRSYFEDSTKFEEIVKDIIKKANNE